MIAEKDTTPVPQHMQAGIASAAGVRCASLADGFEVFWSKCGCAGFPAQPFL